MERTAAPATLFRFGLFEADAARGTLTRNAARVRIQDQPFRVLILLLEKPGEIVSREVLRQKLWPEGTYVDFDGSLNVILKKLRAAIDDDSDNPRFIETVPRRGYRFLAPISVQSTKPEPVPVETPTKPAEIPPQPTPTTAARSRPYLLYAAAAIAIAVLSAAVWFGFRSRASAANVFAGSSARAPRRSVAVLGFHNVAGKAEDGWLGAALSEMLSTELAGGEKLRLVSGEDVANLRLSSPWSQTDTLDQQTTARLAAALNSDLLVLGSYTIVAKGGRGQLRVDVRLQDAKTGEILTEIAEIGSTEDVFRLVSRIGGKLRDRLGVAPLEDTEQAGVIASLPMSPSAAKFYALGVQKLRAFDVLPAKDLLEEATKADPKFALGHAMLARAWAQLGYQQKWREEDKKAFDLSTDLPPAERMLVEGDYYESLGNHEKAASTYRALFELFPDNIDYGLQLAGADTIAGHGTQALETLHRLRALPAPASADPRIDMAEARIVMSKVAAVALLQTAVKKATLQGKGLLYAQARR